MFLHQRLREASGVRRIPALFRSSVKSEHAPRVALACLHATAPEYGALQTLRAVRLTYIECQDKRRSPAHIAKILSIFPATCFRRSCGSTPGGRQAGSALAQPV